MMTSSKKLWKICAGLGIWIRVLNLFKENEDWLGREMLLIGGR